MPWYIMKYAHLRVGQLEDALAELLATSKEKRKNTGYGGA